MYRRITVLVVLSLFFLLANSSLAASSDTLDWDVVAPGIEFHQFQLPDPNNIFVVRMDRINSNAIIDTSIATGALAEGRETVSGMYARYDQALNYWGGGQNPPTWGMRNQVVVAINGIYFNWSSGMPQGGQIQSGWYAKRFDELGSGLSGFAWKLNRNVFIGECVEHRPEKQLITYPATGVTQEFGDINDPPDYNELVIFTPQYNTRTGTNNSVVEVVVELERPTMILPEPAVARGYVRNVFVNAGNHLIPFNSIVLSATGDAASILQANAVIDSEIGISQEITSYEGDCQTPMEDLWTKTYASIQGGYYYLKADQIRDYPDNGAIARNPRTAVAYDDQYVYFIVVDGRDRSHSVGMSIHELAVFTRDTLGAPYAVAEDGGGSSTMVINGQVVNNSYCNHFGCVGFFNIYLPSISRSSRFVGSEMKSILASQSSPQIYERRVANGLLMVIPLGAEYSHQFVPGDIVSANQDVEVRLGPGTNYPSFASIPAGSQGTINDQMNGLNGVLAKSSYWWYVNFGGIKGWVTQGAINRVESIIDITTMR